jgi:hypothetical protein
MVADSRIATRVTSGAKERFATLAQCQGVSESALLKPLIEAALLTAPVIQTQSPQINERRCPTHDGTIIGACFLPLSGPITGEQNISFVGLTPTCLPFTWAVFNCNRS